MQLEDTGDAVFSQALSGSATYSPVVLVFPCDAAQSVLWCVSELLKRIVQFMTSSDVQGFLVEHSAALPSDSAPFYPNLS